MGVMLVNSGDYAGKPEENDAQYPRYVAHSRGLDLADSDGYGTPSAEAIAWLGDVQRTLDYAWEHARDAQGLFETDFTGADKQSEKWLLTQGAMAEMYGRMSGVKLDQTK